MALGSAIRVFAFALGTALDLFLLTLLARRVRAGFLEKLILCALLAAGVWYGANGFALFYRIVSEGEGRWMGAVVEAATLAALLVPTIVVHLAVFWTTGKAWIGAFVYAAGPVAWRLEHAGHLVAVRALFAASLLLAAGMFWFAAIRCNDLMRSRFQRAIAISLVIVLAGWIAGEGSAVAVTASLAPLACIAWFIYRYNFLGLLIGKKIPFALVAGIVSALYLLAVRRAADSAEFDFGAFGPVIEVVLILAAGLIWIPLYSWMNGVFSKRTQLSAELSKRVIQEAAGILDLKLKLQFLAKEVGLTFRLRRVLLDALQGASSQGKFGTPEPNIDSSMLEALVAAVQAQKPEVVSLANAAHGGLHKLLADTGFNCLFPLWYEDQLMGVLLVDCFPRVYLDDDEAIILGLSRQISHAIRTHRLMEDTMHLQRTLLQQEHLAALGKVIVDTAHEIKNPLVPIKSLAQTIHADPALDQRHKTDLEHMIAEVNRLDHIARQMLQYGRPASMETTDVNVRDLFENTTWAVAREYASRGVNIEHFVAPDVVLRGINGQALHLIVLNLVLNAVQACDEIGSVRLSAVASPERHVSITVSDPGPGIPAQLRERIFEPFVSTKPGGTGLGLAIVKKKVVELRGELRLESPISNGRGTSITVTIPSR
jgi:signal transduction histidine kinase